MKFIGMHFLTFVILLFAFTNICAGENEKKSVEEDRDDNGDDSKEESMAIPVENEATNLPCTRRTNGLKHEIRNAQPKQFPFIAAVLSAHNEYLCSGSIISNGLVLTTAKCVQQPVSYILLNATKATKDETTVMLHVIKTEKFPTYTGTEMLKDVGLIYTERHNRSIATKIRLSNYTSASNISDLEAVGYGLNAETGQQKALQYIGAELRAMLVLEGDILRAYFDCVDTKVPTCFKDFGGPVIFDDELIGIVIKGQEDCTREMSSKYAINKKIADILPTYVFKNWLDKKIMKNDEQQKAVQLASFPSRPLSGRRYLREGEVTTAAPTAAGDRFNPTLKLILPALSAFFVISQDCYKLY